MAVQHSNERLGIDVIDELFDRDGVAVQQLSKPKGG